MVAGIVVIAVFVLAVIYFEIGMRLTRNDGTRDWVRYKESLPSIIIGGINLALTLCGDD